jgi:hypothetical protein
MRTRPVPRAGVVLAPGVEFPCLHVAAINRELPRIEEPIIANRSFRCVEVVRLADDDKCGPGVD